MTAQKSLDKLTMVLIWDRLKEAAHTLNRLPKPTVQGYKSNWPPMIMEFHESYGYNDAMVRLGPPSARHISEMDEALSWLNLLEPEPDYIRKLVFLRANDVRYKKLERLFGRSRVTLHLNIRNALHDIMRALEKQKRLPTRRVSTHAMRARS